MLRPLNRERELLRQLVGFQRGVGVGDRIRLEKTIKESDRSSLSLLALSLVISLTPEFLSGDRLKSGL